MEIDLRKIKVPKYRPDGAYVTKTPPINSVASQRGFKLKDKVTGSIHTLTGKYARVSGYIVGFCGDDVVVYSKKDNAFYFVRGKNVFKDKHTWDWRRSLFNNPQW